MEETIIDQRKAKAEALRAAGHNPYANDFQVSDLAGELQTAHAKVDLEALAATPVPAQIAGRVMAVRKFGKVSFLVIADRTGRIQATLFKMQMDPEVFALLEHLDVGDIVGVAGPLMRTRKGELSVKVETLRILTKGLRPLPDKWSGLKDVSTRYRQRYVDLIMNAEARRTFEIRSQVVSYMRRFFEDRGYMEV